MTHDALCKWAIDGVLEARRRGTPEAMVSQMIRDHHDNLAFRCLLWPATLTSIAIAVLASHYDDR